MNFYPHHIGDFRSGTIHLDRLARWLYRDLIEVYYDTERPLPANDDEVCLLIGAVTQTERDAVRIILKRKFQLTNDGYHNTRCDEEIAKYRNKSEKAKISSEAGRAARAAKQSEKVISVTQAVSDEGRTDIESASFDHRPITERPTNQEPVTNNQEPDSFTPPDGGVVPADGEDIPPRPPKKPCPHQAIITLYHEILPMCPQVYAWSDTRRKYLAARWNEKPEHQDLEFWRGYFTYVAKSKFLTGRTIGKDGGPPFLADLEWLIRPTNFLKVCEGKYENA